VRSRQLTIPGAWHFTPEVFPDSRGSFTNWFIADVFAQTVGHRLTVAQTNHSVSRRGVVRGVHFAQVPPGQAKYVYCSRGAMLDFVVDVRVGSPTFGQYDVARLDSASYQAVYLAEGLGHIVVALEDDTVTNYLCSTGYDPAREFGVDPLDPALGIPYPRDLELVLSARDKTAPRLDQAADRGILPTFADCQDRYASLRAAARVDA
jgi:5-epimerase